MKYCCKSQATRLVYRSVSDRQYTMTNYQFGDNAATPTPRHPPTQKPVMKHGLYLYVYSSVGVPVKVIEAESYTKPFGKYSDSEKQISESMKTRWDVWFSLSFRTTARRRRENEREKKALWSWSVCMTFDMLTLDVWRHMTTLAPKEWLDTSFEISSTWNFNVGKIFTPLENTLR